jgi:hypothetical protein
MTGTATGLVIALPTLEVVDIEIESHTAVRAEVKDRDPGSGQCTRETRHTLGVDPDQGRDMMVIDAKFEVAKNGAPRSLAKQPQSTICDARVKTGIVMPLEKAPATVEILTNCLRWECLIYPKSTLCAI